MNLPLLLGHRGARAVRSIPENTFASFDRALADGCDGFEFDVRLTADGAAVICHDPRANRIEIAGATAQNLTWLPRLEDVLSRYQHSAFLNIELKVSGLEQIIAALLRKHAPDRGVVVSSFLPEVLRAMHAADDTIPLGLIGEKPAQLHRWKELPVSHVIPHYKLMGADLISALKADGKKIFVWTVNRPSRMRELAALGVDGIISDETNVLCQTLKRFSPDS
jgi:glycerophosphoryl diester phosphodiesterase